MAYVFGTTFVCDGMDNAKKVKKREPFFVKEKKRKGKLINNQKKANKPEKSKLANKQATIIIFLKGEKNQEPFQEPKL